ncbi:MAG: Glu/Leu/Phe/Val dehydrogenase family protein [Deltaproteobacteria bacterium]|nr:MAG: Glu/Leu/Phe/Val dehydrogenase family protein [Deltaproteobacteria bacterium]
MIRDGQHQGIECFYNRKGEVRFISHMHSNGLGINNGYHAIRAGGIRRHEPEKEELDVIIDGLNLARAMSFKNAAALVPFGGSKITVQCESVKLDDLYTIAFLAFCLDKTRSVTGPDMGFSPGLADVMKEYGYSVNIAGGFKSKLGPTGKPTAYGVYLGLKEAVRFRHGTSDLTGKTIVVQGVGAVGYPLVETYLMQEEVRVFCADIHPEPVEELVSQFSGKVERIHPGDVLTKEADFFLPCAVGGILDEQAIRKLKYSIVMGAANNQLKATNPDEEMRLARLLHQRGILFQVDWIHNAGGVIAGMEGYMYGEKASMENIFAQVEKACKLGTRENLAGAREAGTTPTERAYRYYSKRVFRREGYSTERGHD